MLQSQKEIKYDFLMVDGKAVRLAPHEDGFVPCASVLVVVEDSLEHRMLQDPLAPC